jgi:hypothetical protein
VRSGFSHGLMGYLLMDRPTTVENDKYLAEVDNYAMRNSWKAFGGEMFGSLTSDLPVYIATGVGVKQMGNAVLRAAQTANVASPAVAYLARGVANIRRAYAGDKSIHVAKRILARGMREFSVGFIAGGISESIQQTMGKAGDMQAVVDRAVMDGMLSVPFAEMLRPFGKIAGAGFRSARAKDATEIAKVVSDYFDYIPGIGPMAYRSVVHFIPRSGAHPVPPPGPPGAPPPVVSARLGITPPGSPVANPVRPIAPPPPIVPGLSLLQGIDDTAVAASHSATGKAASVDKLNAYLHKVFTEPWTNGFVDAREAAAARANFVNGGKGKFSKYLAHAGYSLDTVAGATAFVKDIHTMFTAPFKHATADAFLTEVLPIAARDAVELRNLPSDFVSVYTTALRSGTFVPTAHAPAVTALTNWLTKMYGPLLDGFKKDLGGRSLTTVGAAPGKIAARISKLNLTPENLDGEVRMKVLRNEADADARDTIDGTKAGFLAGDSYAIPKTAAGRKLQAAQRVAGNFAYAHHIDFLNLLHRIPGFSKLVSRMPQAANDFAKIRIGIMDAYHNTFHANGGTELALEGLHIARPVRLELQGKPATKGGPKTVENWDIKATGDERIEFTLMVMDGLKKDMTPIDGPSGYRASTEQGHGFGGRDIILTEAQRDAIVSGALLNDQEKILALAIQAGYRASVDPTNALSEKSIGLRLFNKENHHYHPQRVSGEDKLSVALSEHVSSSPDRGILRGNYLARQGGGVADVKGSAIANLISYSRRVAQTSSHFDIVRQAWQARKANEAEFTNLLGKDLMTVFDNLTEVVAGTVTPKDGSTAWLSTWYSIRTVGMLSLQAVSIAKQSAAVWTGLATGRVDGSGGQLFKRSWHLFTHPTERHAQSQALKDRLPWWNLRQREGIQIPEVDSVRARSIGIGGYKSLFGKIPIKKVAELALKHKIPYSEAWLDLLEKGMGGISAMDEATGLTIYEGVARKVLREAGETVMTPELQQAVDGEFIMVMKRSQMTGDVDTRSTMQMDSHFLSKALTQFSTEPRKSWQAIDEALARHVNKPKHLRSAADNQAFARVILPTMASLAYITAVGLVGRKVMDLPLQLIRSKEQQKRRDAQVQHIALQVFNESIGNVFGLSPVAGRTGGEFIKAVVSGSARLAGAEGGGGHISLFDIPIFTELEKMLNGALNTSPGQVVEGAGAASGVPSLFYKPAAAGTHALLKD